MDIFLVTAPGLEHLLADEAREKGFEVTDTSPGGVSLLGDWLAVQRANLEMRGATRVLARLAEFRAMHLAQLDKRARKLPWSDWLRPDVPVKVEATCRKSRIYHHRAASQRVARAITETVGAEVKDRAPVTIKVRIEDDLCTISVDTSGESLHKRGIKQQVNKAPMRETLASLFLRECGFNGHEPVYDPMCGSGTFPIEAAEIAMGLPPGRARNFAYQHLAIDIPDRSDATQQEMGRAPRYFGSDRDTGAITMSTANAERAGVSALTSFTSCAISDAEPPTEEPGLVIINPPYGGRVGNKKPLYGLYASLGETLKSRFTGWRVGLVTSEPSLAKATGLNFQPPGPFVDHGGLKIRLWQTGTLV